ncbi:hypothetical protein [Thiothrix lacustris]|uniref:hypothetical protein n=1 Tax=Thiothrix lacustris TaxID=525917 RepID=UPI00048D0D22|nr:hypothetical protein [Thiothrix lacustris]
MSGRIDRFKKRKEIIKKNQSLPFIRGVIDQELVDKLLHQGIDSNRVASLDYSTDLNVSVEVNASEVEALLSDLRASFNKDRLEHFLGETKHSVISSIAGPFGLGKIISAYDKTGGNVTTINNANNGVYAKDEDRYKRENYTHSKNSEGKQFANAGKNSAGAIYTRSQMDENQMVQDAYTGKVVKADTTSPDHIESLSQYHKNGGFMQTSEKKADFATDEDNLALTDRSINQSMRDFDKEEWLSKQNKSGIENKERFDIDEKKLKEQIQKGKETSAMHLPSNTDKAKYYLKNSVSTGVGEGAKMGVQQAFGYLLVEFFSSAIIEIKDAYNNGLEGNSLYKDIKTRLIRIGRNIADKWKGVVEGFSAGFISGFISNIITTLVNMFVTTAKRLVRMIREGVFSLLKALKLILFPPADMSFTEATHEAMKLIAVGGIVIAGVALEEVIEKIVLSVPFLAPFASVATAVIVGSLTAIAMSLVAYLIDKMDILGIIKSQETRYVLDKLDKDIDERLKRCESISEEMDGFLNQNSLLLPQAS